MAVCDAGSQLKFSPLAKDNFLRGLKEVIEEYTVV
jgi:hypothetical protein